MSPVNTSNKIKQRNGKWTTVRIVTTPDGACFDTNGKPMYVTGPNPMDPEEKPKEYPVPFNPHNPDIFRTTDFHAALSFVKRNDIKHCDGKIVEFEIFVPNPGKTCHVIDDFRLYRSTPDMWLRRGVENITYMKISLGLRNTQHSARMKRQEFAASCRRRGFFGIPK